MFCRGSLDSLAPWTGKRSSYAVHHIWNNISFPYSGLPHGRSDCAWNSEGVLGHTAWFWNLNILSWLPTEVLSGNGEEPLWNQAIPIHQQVCTGTFWRISLAFSIRPKSQLPWGLGEHYISPLRGLLVGVTWSALGWRFYHQSTDCSSATFWLVVDRCKWPPDCHFGVERMTRTNQCTFLDSCLYKSGLMTLADVQSDCAEQRAVPHPHYLTCTNFHHCRHYLTHPLFFVFAVPSVDVRDYNRMILANPSPYWGVRHTYEPQLE